MPRLEFCTRCGTPRAGAPRFCPNCGADLGPAEEAPGGETSRDPAPAVVTVASPTVASPTVASPTVANRTVAKKRSLGGMRREVHPARAWRSLRPYVIFAAIFLALGLPGVALLRDAIAHEGNLILPFVLLALPLFWVGLGLARLVGVVVPLLRNGHDGAQGLVAIVAAVALGAGLYQGVRTLEAGGPAGWQPDPNLVAALAPACGGHAVPGAGTVDTSGTTLNRLVVLDSSGREHDWSGRPPVEWRPATLADAQLVACISSEPTTEIVEVCRYGDGSTITRYRATYALAVFEAGTGRRLADLSITGEPRECLETERSDVTEIQGDVGWPIVQQHLAGLVVHGVFQEPDASPGPSAAPAAAGPGTPSLAWVSRT